MALSLFVPPPKPDPPKFERAAKATMPIVRETGLSFGVINRRDGVSGRRNPAGTPFVPTPSPRPRTAARSPSGRSAAEHAAACGVDRTSGAPLVRFPEVHDGYDRLGMVHEARGENRQAADCYRKVIEFIREHPDDYDPGFEDMFTKLVNRLDPPVAT
jgi:hypothetical protein